MNGYSDDYVRERLNQTNNMNQGFTTNTVEEKTLDSKTVKQMQELVSKKMYELYGSQILTDKTEDFKNTLHQSIQFIIQEYYSSLSIIQINKEAQKIFNLICGLGPLEQLLNDESITEIMVTRYDKIYVEKKGKLILYNDIKFDSERDLRNTIDKIVQPIGRTIDESKPIVDARLSDGSRVHAIVPPICPDGCLLTIRKFSKKKLTGEDYLSFGSLNEKMLDFLQRAVRSRFNIMVSGGTGTGKTTLLNMLSNYIPSTESLITVEDSCELILVQDNVRRLEARQGNAENKGAVLIRDLVKATLRMRPDRIIVGEIRDGVIVDLFRALSSGHDGGISTIHANNPDDLVSSVMPILFGMSDMNFTEEARNRLIASALDLIVQITRFSDGTRKLSKITHVVGIGKKQARLARLSQQEIDEIEPNEIIIKDIFVFKQTGKQNNKIMGEYVTTGYVPYELLDKFELDGNPLPGGEDFFKASTDDNMDILSRKGNNLGVGEFNNLYNVPVENYKKEKEKEYENINIEMPDLSPTNPINVSNNESYIQMPDLSPNTSDNKTEGIYMPDLSKEDKNFENTHMKNDNQNNFIYNENMNNDLSTEGFYNNEVNSSTTVDIDSLLKNNSITLQEQKTQIVDNNVIQENKDLKVDSNTKENKSNKVNNNSKVRMTLEF